MSGHHLAAARKRAAAVLAGAVDRRSLLVGVLVLDGQGEVVEVVGPFGSEQAARAWAALRGVGPVRLVPFRPAV